MKVCTKSNEFLSNLNSTFFDFWYIGGIIVDTLGFPATGTQTNPISSQICHKTKKLEERTKTSSVSHFLSEWLDVDGWANILSQRAMPIYTSWRDSCTYHCYAFWKSIFHHKRNMPDSVLHKYPW